VPDSPASALVSRLARLYTGVVSDCLDAVGIRGNVMSPAIRPVYPAARLAGIAATVHATDVEGVPADPADHYKGIIAAVDALRPGEVMVVSTTRGSVWGELMATASRYRGARGVVVDGYTRDVTALAEQGFPTFCTGMSPADSLGRVEITAAGIPISCGGVAVRPGDLVIGDYDGVVVVPHEVAEEVLARAEQKVAGEDVVRAKLAEGMPVAAAFREYGVI
jgi:4-hydroxy-4-methyl-2-oxoglutarate aldolase